MKFLQVTSQSGKTFTINLDLVTAIEPIAKDDNAKGAIIYFVFPDDILKVVDDYGALIGRLMG